LLLPSLVARPYLYLLYIYVQAGEKNHNQEGVGSTVGNTVGDAAGVAVFVPVVPFVGEGVTGTIPVAITSVK
jgi:hypothetical protein